MYQLSINYKLRKTHNITLKISILFKVETSEITEYDPKSGKIILELLFLGVILLTNSMVN